MWSIDFQEEPQASGSNRLPKPFIKAYHFSFLDYLPNWYFFWHLHNSAAELVVITAGHGFLNIGNKKIPLSKGYVCIVPPHILHYYSSSEHDALNYYSIGIQTEDTDNELAFFFRNLDCSVIPMESENCFLESSCRVLAAQLKSNGNYADEVFQSVLYGMLIWIRRQAQTMRIEPVAHSKFAIQDVLAYISEHYPENLNLNQLSHRFGISPVHLSRLFKQVCGISPINYVIYYRITQAVIMLQKTDMSIADITSAVGYQNQAHFTKLFSQHIGYTPTDFRTKIKAEQKSIYNNSVF